MTDATTEPVRDSALIPRQRSVLLLLHEMSAAVGPMSERAQKLSLQYLVERRRCPLCGADATQWCRTFGWTSTVMRTHVARLQLTRAQMIRAARWGLNEEERLQRLKRTLAGRGDHDASGDSEDDEDEQ